MNKHSKYYKLKFIAGELSGRIFALDNFVLIGRSREAGIRPGASDIAPEHISLAVEDDGSVMMHVYSDAPTAVNDFELAGDSDINLPLLSDVRLGKDLVFILEEATAAEMPQLPPVTDETGEEELPTEDVTSDMDDEDISEKEEISNGNADEKKEDPSSSPQPESKENLTRYASEAELNTLKKINRTLKLKRKFLLLCGAAASLAIGGGAYLYSELQIENPLTWPGLLENKIDDSEFFVDMGNGAKCIAYYPNTPFMKVNKKERYCEVMTAVGRRKDVPFHLLLTVTDLKNGFFIPTDTSYNAWNRQMSEKHAFSFQGEKMRTFFRPQAHGFPAYNQNYIRTFGELRWQGVATYARWQDKEIVLLREVPLKHYQRAKTLIEAFDCLVVTSAWSNRHWEIPKTFFPGVPEDLLVRANRELAQNINFISWSDLSLMLRTLLSYAAAKKDSKMLDSVIPLWLDFREKQQIWYTQRCLSYIAYRNVGNQNGMRKILNSCLRHFRTPDDYRHIRILENIWEIQ